MAVRVTIRKAMLCQSKVHDITWNTQKNCEVETGSLQQFTRDVKNHHRSVYNAGYAIPDHVTPPVQKPLLRTTPPLLRRLQAKS